MPAAFFKKNTLEQTAFTLNAGGFGYRGKSYKFADVAKTVFYREGPGTKVVLASSGFDYAVSVLFVMRSGVYVQLTEQPTWFSDPKLENVERIQEIYDVVSANSYQNRLNKYSTQVENTGCFEYAGWQFHPKQGKLIHAASRQEFDIQDLEFLRSNGFLEVVNKKGGVGARLVRRIKGSVAISTLTDTDVFYALMRHYFGVGWS